MVSNWQRWSEDPDRGAEVRRGGEKRFGLAILAKFSGRYGGVVTLNQINNNSILTVMGRDRHTRTITGSYRAQERSPA